MFFSPAVFLFFHYTRLQPKMQEVFGMRVRIF